MPTVNRQINKQENLHCRHCKCTGPQHLYALVFTYRKLDICGGVLAKKKQFQHFHILGRCTCDLPTSQYVMGQQSDLQNITVFIIFLSSLYLITSYISALYPYISYIIINFLNLIFLNQNITVFIIFLSSLYLITSYISALYPYISYIIIIFLNLIFLNQTICSGVTAKIRVRHFSNFHTITSSFDVSNQKCNGDPGTIVRHFGFT